MKNVPHLFSMLLFGIVVITMAVYVLLPPPTTTCNCNCKHCPERCAEKCDDTKCYPALCRCKDCVCDKTKINL